MTPEPDSDAYAYNFVEVPKQCVVCNKVHVITVDKASYDRWRAGELIQNVWPEKTVVEREALISGICSQVCWDKLWRD